MRPATTRVLLGSVLVIVTMVGTTVAAAIEDRLSGDQLFHTLADSDERSTDEMNDMTANSEFDYLTRMVRHDQEAVAAAEQLRRSGTPEVRRLGATIVTTRTADITRMRAWLARWYPGRATAAGYRPTMRDLSKLSGDALDETFLEDMIPHHEAAVMMAQHLLRHRSVRHEEIAAFARAVRDAGHAETFRMRCLLEIETRERPARPITPITPLTPTRRSTA